MSIQQKIEAAKQRVQSAKVPLNKALWGQVKSVLDANDVPYTNKVTSPYLESVQVILDASAISDSTVSKLAKALTQLKKAFRKSDEYEAGLHAVKGGLALIVVAYDEPEEKEYGEDDDL